MVIVVRRIDCWGHFPVGAISSKMRTSIAAVVVAIVVYSTLLDVHFQQDVGLRLFMQHSFIEIRIQEWTEKKQKYQNYFTTTTMLL